MHREKTYNEKELLLHLEAGSEAALREILKRYKNKLTAYVLNMTRSREVTEEIVQDCFVQIWATREGLGKVKDFSKFLFIICRNQTINSFRKTLRDRQKQRQLEEQYVREIPQEQPGEEEMLVNLVNKAVDHLPPQQRAAWNMSRREGRKYADIAEAMKVSRETVKKHIQYANAFIIEFLKENKDYLLCLAWLMILLKMTAGAFYRL